MFRYRAALDADDVCIFADVHVKYGAHAIVGDRPLEELARHIEFSMPTSRSRPENGPAIPRASTKSKTIVGATSLPVLIGSGVTEDASIDYSRSRMASSLAAP